MKKIILAAMLLASAFAAKAVDFTYSTNLFYALTYPTNIYLGTNGTTNATDRDTVVIAWNKVNAAQNLFWRTIQTSQSNLTTVSNGVTKLNAYTNQIYASNSWSLAIATNGLQNGGFRLWNSNGTPVLIQLSNSVPFIRGI